MAYYSLRSREWEELESLISNRDKDGIISLFVRIGDMPKTKKGFPPKNAKSMLHLYGRMFELVIQAHDASFYKSLRKSGMPRLDGSRELLFSTLYNLYFGYEKYEDEHGFGKTMRDPRGPSCEQEEAVADFISAVLDDGYALNQPPYERNNSDLLIRLFARSMSRHVDLLPRLEAAGYVTIPEFNSQWDDIISSNNTSYAEYCLGKGSRPNAPLVLDAMVKTETLDWLADHDVPVKAVSPAAHRDVLARCVGLGIPLEGRDDTQALETRLEEGGKELDFGVRNGVLLRYWGNDEEVIIPEGVTRVAALAFCGNANARRVVVPDGVRVIEEFAFAGCNVLEEVSLPASLASLGESQPGFVGLEERTFVDCPRLTRMDMREQTGEHNSVDGILCTGFGIVSLIPPARLQADALCIPEGIRFWNGKVRSVAKSLHLPASLGEFHAWAKSDFPALERISVDDASTVMRVRDNVLYQKRDDGMWCAIACPSNACGRVELLPDCTAVEKRAFAGCSELTVCIGVTARTFGKEAFAGCKAIEIQDDREIPFSEKVFSKESVCQLMTPHIPIGRIGSGLKIHAALGYIHMVCEGRSLDAELDAGFAKYVKSQRKRLFPLMASDAAVATYLLCEGLVQRKELPQLAALMEGVTNEDVRARAERYASEPKALPGWRESIAASKAGGVEPPAQSAELELLVARELANREISRRISTRVDCGARLADGSGVSSPEALQLLVELCYVPRKGVDPVRFHVEKYPKPSSPTGFHKCAFFRSGSRSGKLIDALAALFDGDDLSDRLVEVFYDKGVSDALAALARFGNDRAIGLLVDSMRKWDEWDGRGNSRKDLAIARGAMMYNDSLEAARHLDSVNLLSAYAQARNRDEDELRDTLLCDFGFASDGTKQYDLGTKTVRVTVDEELNLSLYDESAGKVVKSVPKRGADAEKYQAAVADLASTRRAVRAEGKRRRDLLLDHYLDGHKWQAESWRQSYLLNPVIKGASRHVVWQQGDATFVLYGGALVDSTGKPVELGNGVVKVAHPIEMGREEVESWRRFFSERGVRQPFVQVWEKVVDMDAVKGYRFEGCPISAYWFKGQEGLGIRLSVGAHERLTQQFDITFDSATCRVKQVGLGLDLNNRVEILNFKIQPRDAPRRLNRLVAYLDHACLYPRLEAGDLTVMDDLWDPTLKQLVDYTTVASTNGRTELVAKLLEYRTEWFPS